jgi:AcrR family transcriptional regulator
VLRDGERLELADAPDWLEDVNNFNNGAGAGLGTSNIGTYVLSSQYSGEEYLFSSKHELLFGLADQEMAEIPSCITLLEHDVPAWDGLRDFIRSYCVCYSNRDAAILYLDISAEAMRQPDIARPFVKARNSLADALSSVISRGVEAKNFKHALDDLAMANMILDFIEGAAARGVIDGINPLDLATSVESFVLSARVFRK